MNKTMMIGFIILILITCSALVLSIYNFNKTENGRWVCIAKTCSSFLTEDEWIGKFCRTNEQKTNLICNVTVDNVNVDIPLSNINVSKIQACDEYTCVANVFVKATGQYEENILKGG